MYTLIGSHLTLFSLFVRQVWLFYFIIHSFLTFFYSNATYESYKDEATFSAHGLVTLMSFTTTQFIPNSCIEITYFPKVGNFFRLTVNRIIKGHILVWHHVSDFLILYAFHGFF